MSKGTDQVAYEMILKNLILHIGDKEAEMSMVKV